MQLCLPSCFRFLLAKTKNDPVLLWGWRKFFCFFEEKGGMGIKTFCCKQEQARFAERVYFRE